MINPPKRDTSSNSAFSNFNGFDPQFFFDKILPFRKSLNEKGILTCPFPYGYKLDNTEEKYGKKIFPLAAWKKGEALNQIQMPHLKSPFNYIVKTGKCNGFLVIDYDFPKLDEGEIDGKEWLESLFPKEHDFWKTKQVQSGSGGIHFYFKYDDRLKCGTTRCIYLNGVKSKISLDMRTDGNCVIGELSVNEKGVYQPLNNTTFDDIIEVPEELMSYLIKPKTQNISSIVNQTPVENLTHTNNDSNISADKLKYIDCLSGNEHIFGEHGLWWDLCKVCATFYNFNYFWAISQKAPSKSGKKNNMQSCKEKFEDAKKYPVNFGLLVNIIKEHLPQVYNEHFGYVNKYIYKGTQESFNQILYNTYKDKFKWDADNSVWYECIEGLWYKRDKDNLVMRRLIAEDLVKIFSKRIYYLSGKIVEIQNSGKSEDECKAEVKSLKDLIAIVSMQEDWCYKNGMRASFVNSARDMFYDYEFTKKLDSVEYSGNYFSFNNGYIDLKEYFESKEIILHRHLPENYISMTCGYDYVPLDNIEDEILYKIKNTIDDIMPCEEDRDYLLQSLATCLTAGNDNECIITAYGKTGGNGKGVLLSDLMTCVFGSYSGTFKTANIVGKKSIDPESPSSGLASIMNARYVIMTEPDKGQDLNNDALKLLSGGDELCFRKLHENMQKRKPAFTIFLQANHILNADSYDDAVWRRLKYLHFNQTFRTNPNLERGEKQADTTLKSTFRDNVKYRQAFFHLLLNNYDPVLKDTPNILKYINEAREDSDFIQSYIDSQIEQTDEKDMNFGWNYDQVKFITFKELKKRFTKWYKEEYDEDIPCKPMELKTLFKQKLDNHKKTHKTRIYEESFDHTYTPIMNGNRQKQKNWGESFIGYKFSMGIEEEEDNATNDLDM